MFNFNALNRTWKNNVNLNICTNNLKIWMNRMKKSPVTRHYVFVCALPLSFTLLFCVLIPCDTVWYNANFMCKWISNRNRILCGRFSGNHMVYIHDYYVATNVLHTRRFFDIWCALVALFSTSQQEANRSFQLWLSSAKNTFYFNDQIKC